MHFCSPLTAKRPSGILIELSLYTFPCRHIQVYQTHTSVGKSCIPRSIISICHTYGCQMCWDSTISHKSAHDGPRVTYGVSVECVRPKAQAACGPGGGPARRRPRWLQASAPSQATPGPPGTVACTCLQQGWRPHAWTFCPTPQQELLLLQSAVGAMARWGSWKLAHEVQACRASTAAAERAQQLCRREPCVS